MLPIARLIASTITVITMCEKVVTVFSLFPVVRRRVDNIIIVAEEVGKS